MDSKRITIGIDPGYGRMGWAIIIGDVDDGKLIDVGCIETFPTSTHAQRLSQVASELRVLFDKYAPTCMAIETLYFSNNKTTGLAVAEARGVALAIAGAFNIEVREFGPKQVKLAVTGSGAADKRQVQEMVKRLLKLDTIPQPDDAADACAVALTGIVS